jgi:cytochrome P450
MFKVKVSSPILPMKLPAGPTTPQLLQLIQWISDPLGFMERCRQQYGDIFTANFSQLGPLIFISNPQLIQEIYTANPKQYDAGRSNEILKFLLGDNSIVLVDGDRHRRQRQLLMPPFHGERMRNYGQLICEVTQKSTKNWSTGTFFETRPLMQEITLSVILQAVFGLYEGSRYQQLKSMLSALLEMMNSPLRSSVLFFKFLQKDWGNWSPWGRMKRRIAEIDQLLYAEMADRRANPNPNRTDILTLLMSARDEAGQPMSDVELRDELMTLLFAGHETTATALTWALYWIQYIPEVRETLLQELVGLSENPDPMSMVKLPYLNAVCQETLRLYPVAMISFIRVANLPVKLGEHEFDAETFLAPCIYLVHRHPEIYPEPAQFKPERFINRQYSPYEFLPFGGGNRLCIGYALAQFEMKLVLATLLSHWQLELAENKPVKPSRRGVTLAQSTNIRMRVLGRQEMTKF